MKVSVLGCGRWGTYQGWYADHIGHDVLIWGRPGSRNLETLVQTRKNDYLNLTPTMALTDDLKKAVQHGDMIIISVSSQHLRDLAIKLNQLDLKGKTFILAMKGIENETGMRLTKVMESEIQQKINLAIWVGPGHVQSFVKGIPNCMLISSENIDVTKSIIEAFSSDLIRLYIGQDLIGNEIGAAAKNVIGIAAGMLDGFDYGSLKGALMARGSREISRLVRAMGGNELTIYGLSHIGDYEATLFSPFSNNRRFGEDFVKKIPFTKLAEGASTVKSLMLLSEKYQVELPVCQAIYDVLYNEKDPKEVLSNLFVRPTTFEF
ncbi:MAG: NAD(P)H-dependent glycerol-3-phosphate dehydrogenase [Clostridia bacterium]|nr:NAD(P)H-dependent glycerol-3-phosphate dehydrogenase [Clostridia bacterium]